MYYNFLLIILYDEINKSKKAFKNSNQILRVTQIYISRNIKIDKYIYIFN